MHAYRHTKHPNLAYPSGNILPPPPHLQRERETDKQMKKLDEGQATLLLCRCSGTAKTEVWRTSPPPQLTPQPGCLEYISKLDQHVPAAPNRSAPRRKAIKDPQIRMINSYSHKVTREQKAIESTVCGHMPGLEHAANPCHGERTGAL